MGDVVVEVVDGDRKDDDDAEIVADEKDVGDKKDSSSDEADDDAELRGDIVTGGDTGGKKGWTLFEVQEMIVSSVPSNFQS